MPRLSKTDNMTLKKLGPGLLFAGAAIGVSHLVQSTRAGADFGFGLIWALLLVNLFKYPFFQFGPRYAAATNESLLDGYKKLGKGVLIVYLALTLLTMFTIQAAVTIVTAGLAKSLFGLELSIEIWTVIVLVVCTSILLFGSYKLLDRFIKVIIVTLAVSTLIAVLMAILINTEPVSLNQIFPVASNEIIFLIAFMGWMPAPLDISIWHSLWANEKQKTNANIQPKDALFDFNVGYLGTVILGIGFISLGALIMFNSGEAFNNQAGAFAAQLINMYTSSLGQWAYIIIGIAAFTTMFSTTITTLDASPRAMNRTLELILSKRLKNGYKFWLFTLSIGSILIFFFLASEMVLLVKIATILSFITAPFYAIANYRLICSKHTPKEWRPSKLLHILSWLGIIFLISFSIWYLSI